MLSRCSLGSADAAVAGPAQGYAAPRAEAHAGTTSPGELFLQAQNLRQGFGLLPDPLQDSGGGNQGNLASHLHLRSAWVGVQLQASSGGGPKNLHQTPDRKTAAGAATTPVATPDTARSVASSAAGSPDTPLGISLPNSPSGSTLGIKLSPNSPSSNNSQFSAALASGASQPRPPLHQPGQTPASPAVQLLQATDPTKPVFPLNAGSPQPQTAQPQNTRKFPAFSDKKEPPKKYPPTYNLCHNEPLLLMKERWDNLVRPLLCRWRCGSGVLVLLAPYLLFHSGLWLHCPDLMSNTSVLLALLVDSCSARPDQWVLRCRQGRLGPDEDPRGLRQHQVRRAPQLRVPRGTRQR